MLQPATLTITDDSGFLGIANAGTYRSFVSENRELVQLFNHFIEEMNNDHLIIWSTGCENVWTVNFVNKVSEIKSFREFKKTIEVTDGKIFLTNYEDLTMAARYTDEKIPAKHNADLFIALRNGKYELHIRQLFDPDDYNYDPEGKVNFEIAVLSEISETLQQVDNVFWWAQ